MKLYIDSTDPKKTLLKINDHEFSQMVDSPREHDVFSFIKKTFEENQIKPTDITEVEVNLGPGSFTGTRVGVAIANALSFALKIPLNGKKPPLFPIYSQEPNITLPKNKN